MGGFYKVCPVCEGEYRFEVQMCPDCEQPLVERVEGETWERTRFPGRREVLEPSPDLVLVRGAGLAWIDLLASRLAEHGIPSLVHTYPTPEPAAREESLERTELAHRTHHLFVRPDDAVAASEIDRQILVEQVPEMAEVTDLAEADPQVCPACGAPWPSGFPECSSCGLGFGGDEAD